MLRNRTPVGYVAGATVLVCLLAVHAFPARAEPPPGYELRWADEFDGTELDKTKWQQRSPGPRDAAVNVPEAVTVHDGHLTITTYTADGKHYTGMLQSKLARCYGYWEARIQFTDAPGVHSAFWLQSPSVGNPLGDPGKAGVEIDIVEHRAVDGKGKDVSGIASLNLHWDGYKEDHKHKNQTTKDLGLSKGFHTYGLEWTPAEYRFFIDGQVQWAVKEPISHRPEAIILSSEIKDKGWAGPIPKNGYGDRSISKVKMVVDYVRYYEKRP